MDSPKARPAETETTANKQPAREKDAETSRAKTSNGSAAWKSSEEQLRQSHLNRLTRQFRFALDRLNRLDMLRRLVDGRPRQITRRRRVRRSQRLQQELISSLRLQLRRLEGRTEATRYVKPRAPSRIVRRPEASGQTGKQRN